MSVTVVIPTFNRARTLESAIHSIDLQTYRDVEIIIVNDGGHDVTDVVNKWSSRVSLSIYDLPTNEGVSSARNLGMDAAEGDFIAFLDDDDVFLPTHLEDAVGQLTGGAIDLFYCAAYLLDRRLEPPFSAVSSDDRIKRYPFNVQFLNVANFIHTGSVVVRNDRHLRPRFDKSLRFCEDWDMWLRLVREFNFQGYGITAANSVYHQIQGDAGLVTQGQGVVPSNFSIARMQAYARWVPPSEKVQVFRAAMLDFDRRCDSIVASGGQVRIDAFDRMLSVLYKNFIDDHKPEPLPIEALRR